MKIGTGDYNPDALVEAREVRMLSVSVLCEMTGISRQSYYKYEKGEVVPTPDTVNKISKALGLPYDYFVNKNTANGFEKAHYRALKSAKKSVCRRAEIKLKWLSYIFEYYDKYVDFPDVDIPDFSIDNPQLLTPMEIEHYAQELRSIWKLGSGPISNLAWLLENHGIIISSDELIDHGLDALSGWQNKVNRPFILINRMNQTGVRIRFDLAHELGHLMLHRNVNQGSFEKDKNYFKFIEDQAHRFAAAFLIPQPAMKDEVTYVDLVTLRNMKARWRVSIAMLIMRAFHVGLIDTIKKENLYRMISSRGWRHKEPLDDQIEDDPPALLRECFYTLVEHNILSRNDILSNIHFASKDIETLNLLDEDELVDPRPKVKVISIFPCGRDDSET